MTDGELLCCMMTTADDNVHGCNILTQLARERAAQMSGPRWPQIDSRMHTTKSLVCR